MSEWSMALPQGALEILERLHAAGHEGYAVGGCVRDALLGRQPKDYDLCTDASPEEMQRVFAGLRVIETGLLHGTLTVLLHGTPYEVTTYRVDGEYADHRHPDRVVFVREVERDLARRDFTVNAMAYSPQKGLKDCFGGREDLRAGIIRCVGEARTRFDEDALRILRALRFAAVYGFAIEEETAAAARTLKGTLAHVARERVTVELSKLLCGDGAQRILTEFADVLQAVLPCALHPEGLAQVPAELPLRLAHVLQDAQDASVVMKQALRLDNATVCAAEELIARKDVLCPAEEVAWKRLLRDAGEERTRQLARWKHWDVRTLNALLARGDCWNLKGLAVTGRDLMAAGVPAGREIGRMLEALLEAVICAEVENDRAVLLNLVQKWR